MFSGSRVNVCRVMKRSNERNSMKPKDNKKENTLLYHLHSLPKKIMNLHESEYCMPEFILYDLCHADCFNFGKAAYFIDNPDFDYLQGMVGINREDHSLYHHDHWDKPDDFHQAMEGSEFNKKVRDVCRKSMKRHGESEQEVAQDIATRLQLQHPHCYCWQMKHNNHGFLVTENAETNDEESWKNEYLHNSLYFLNFCPF